MKITNKKAIIIAAYPTIGKTYMGERFANVLDLRTTPYYELGHDIKTHKDCNVTKKITSNIINPLWPNNYITALRKAQNEYDYIFTIVHPEKMLRHLDAAGIEYMLILPKEEDLDIIRERSKARGNGPEFYNALSGVNDILEKTKDKKNCKIVFTERGEYLEEWFKRNNMKLIPVNKTEEAPK